MERKRFRSWVGVWALAALVIALGCGEPAKPTGEIFEAARAGDVDQIKAHIHWKSDLNKRGPSEFTALHFAAVFGQQEIAKLLLDAGADPNLKANRGHTPLHLAAENNQVEIAKMLLDKRVDINAFDNDKMTPYQLAHVSKYKEMLEFLKSKGADTTLRPIVQHPRTATPGGG